MKAWILLTVRRHDFAREHSVRLVGYFRAHAQHLLDVAHALGPPRFGPTNQPRLRYYSHHVDIRWL